MVYNVFRVGVYQLSIEIEQGNLMQQSAKQAIVFFFFLMMFSPLYAMTSNAEVANWASALLQNTVTVNYQELKTHEKRKKYGKYYSGQAKTGIKTFFSEIIPFITDNRLSTNPKPEGPPTITRQGSLNGVPYWQISQTFQFPVLKKTIQFSVMVIENQDPPLLIENLSMQVLD